jgi:Protein of unknown function (DUF3285)
MTTEITSPENQENLEAVVQITPDAEISSTEPVKPPGSYVKLAMRNMVRKRGKSLQHFFLSTAGLLVLFIGLAYLTR